MRRFVGAVVALSLALVGTNAQSPSPLPPVHPLGARLAVSRDTFRVITSVRPLSDGRILVNDAQQRRVFLLDSSFAHGVIVLDSGGKPGTAYGAIGTLSGPAVRPGGLVPYLADTSLFVDPLSLALLVLDPAGRIDRIMAVPRTADIPSMIGNGVTTGARFDGHGSVVYGRAGSPNGARISLADTVGGRSPPGVTWDSVLLLRGSLATKVIDTLGIIQSSAGRPTAITGDASGFHRTSQVINPLPVIDDWTVISSGSVAIVRGQDYHIDWIDPNGTRRSTPKMPHDWHRLSDSERAAIIDSTQQVANSRPGHVSEQQPDGTMRSSLDTAHVVSLDELPYYRAPFFRGVYADAEDHVWARQTTNVAPPAGQGPIYDVIDRQGVVVDRVELPPQFGIVGFGRGVIYLTSREGPGTVLVKQRIR